MLREQTGDLPQVRTLSLLPQDIRAERQVFMVSFESSTILVHT